MSWSSTIYSDTLVSHRSSNSTKSSQSLDERGEFRLLTGNFLSGSTVHTSGKMVGDGLAAEGRDRGMFCTDI